MAREVVWTFRALQDVETIADYIARDSPGYAASLVARLVHAARSLVETSERGRVVPELGDPSIRELIVRPYRLVYRVGEQRIEVLAVIHGRREFRRAWSEGGAPRESSG